MGIEEGEKYLVKECEHIFIHGIFLTLRYTIEELDCTSKATRASASQVQASLERLLGLVVWVTSLVLWVVSVDALDIPKKIESFIDDIQSGNRAYQLTKRILKQQMECKKRILNILRLWDKLSRLSWLVSSLP